MTQRRSKLSSGRNLHRSPATCQLGYEAFVPDQEVKAASQSTAPAADRLPDLDGTARVTAWESRKSPGLLNVARETQSLAGFLFSNSLGELQKSFTSGILFHSLGISCLCSHDYYTTSGHSGCIGRKSFLTCPYSCSQKLRNLWST
jgi:hypothetical protein